MSWSGKGGNERRGYHHGNLREALIDAALMLLAEKGPGAFTIAEAARLAGVSSAAPYRHFRDAEALLAAVAERGYERFAAALAQAWNDGRPDPLRAFEALGQAYLAFARREPALYAAMFETHIAFDAVPSLQTAAERAFAILRQATDRVAAALPEGKRPPSLMMALHIWALSHGIASLFCRADGARRKLPMSPEELLEAGVLIYLQSFGLAGGNVEIKTR
ncbi:MAG TPA: TetR/AcrR family transcriptional regulator [Stellaceae bacterium]|jgi:AcrR family transcriptional regulator